MNKWVTLGIVLTFLIAPCILTIQPVKASSKSIVVPDDYATIQAAIDAASEGSTVFVKSGTYLDQSLVINKPISLIGENQKTTILQGKGDNYPVPQSSDVLTGDLKFTFLGYKTSLLNFVPIPETVIKLDANDATISGFTIGNCNIGINGKGDRIRIVNNSITAKGESCISLQGSYMTIANNSLFGEGASGIISFGGSHNNITDNKITADPGITILGPFNFISENTILGNTGFGIQVMGNLSKISNNNITGGRMGLALVSCADSTFIRNNVTKQSERAIWLDNSNNNIFQENHIVENQGYAIYLSSNNENNTFYGNTFMNNSKSVRFVYDNQSNYWDNGKEGNFWSDYNGVDANYDGIGDTPYVINEKNKDNAPLMNPLPISDTFPSPTPPNQDSFSTWQVIAVLSALTVAIIGLFLYFKQYKR